MVSSVPISFLATSQLRVRTEDCPFPQFPESCDALALVTSPQLLVPQFKLMREIRIKTLKDQDDDREITCQLPLQANQT